MRILMTTTGYPGHVLPLIPFARACALAGHDVGFAGPRACGSLVHRLGFKFHPCEDAPRDEVARTVATAAELAQPDGHAHMIAEGFGRVAPRAALPGIAEAVTGWRPDVIVRESHELAGCVAAERRGLPQVRVALGLAATEDALASLVAGPLDELRGELGLPRDPGGERLRSSQLLTLTPPAFEDPAAPGPRVARRFRDVREEAPPLPEWWPNGDDPLVYLTFGSVAGILGYFPYLYGAALDVLAELPVRVLATVGGDADPAALGRPPANVHVERWVEQDRALQAASAVVTHGGIGSTLGALEHGLPLVVLPLFGDDQFRNARRVAELGAGIALADTDRERRMFDGPDPRLVVALGGAVGAVLDDPGYGAAARRIADDIAALPPVDAAALAV